MIIFRRLIQYLQVEWVYKTVSSTPEFKSNVSLVGQDIHGIILRGTDLMDAGPGSGAEGRHQLSVLTQFDGQFFTINDGCYISKNTQHPC